MRHLLTLTLLFITACRAADEGGEEATNVSSEVPSARLQISSLERRIKEQLETKVESLRITADLEAKVKTAMAAQLFDPGSAQYRELRSGRGGAVCGKYNAKNRYGAYVGFKDFVLSKDGVTLYTSERNDGIKVELFSSFADAYLNVCAGKTERARYAQATERLRSDYGYVDATATDAVAEPDDDPFAGE